jgi:hypothetical protein
MTVILPFYYGDAAELKRLLEWIGQLGGCHNHTAILCADAGVTYHTAIELLELAQAQFYSASVITSQESVSGWPQGANALFMVAAEHMAKVGPWLWLETDCIPIKPNWLDLLDHAYRNQEKPVMGAIIPCKTPGLPEQHVSGCAIYPKNYWDMMKYTLIGTHNVAFDISTAAKAVPIAAHSDLFHCFWGQKDLPPTFTTLRHENHPPNQFTLDAIHPNAVLFHRNKDGTLIQALRQRYFPFVQPDFTRSTNSEFIVVLPFNNKDAPLQTECLNWMKEMGQLPTYDCLLSYDPSCIQPFIAGMLTAARLVFKNVYQFTYPTPKRLSWPQAPNWAFQQVAQYIAKHVNRPWLWKEADMIPLKSDWLDRLQYEYLMCGKPFMGSVVPGMKHANGTSVFPANLPTVCPRAMTCVDEAFDTAMYKDMMPRCHNAIHLMAHVWGLHEGKPHPIVGTPIHFDTEEQVKEWVPLQAITIHRVKDTSLINMLRKMKPQL